MILEVKGLVKHFPQRRRQGVVQAVNGVDIEVEEGSTHGLVGESGCGKSTVARVILRLTEPTAGRARFMGIDLFEAAGEELRSVRRHLQVVFQDPYASLDPRKTVGELVAEPMIIHGTHRGSALRRRVDHLLAQVGLAPQIAGRLPGRLSGGQRQRVGIARALALEPAMIICDEPVSALDLSVQAQILNLLADLQARLRVAYLFISHDLAVVRHLSTTVSVMYLGKIMETGTREQVFGHPSHPYTLALLSAVSGIDPAQEKGRRRIVLTGERPSPVAPPSGCVFRTRCWKAQELCAQEAPALVDRGLGHPVACHFPE
jgi:oligopeptide/dipeptide ABC transporter ATP-binding protein